MNTKALAGTSSNLGIDAALLYHDRANEFESTPARQDMIEVVRKLL